MPAPSVRYKILPARGDKTALDAAIAAIDEGEICYARDEDRFYVKEGGALVLTSMEEAPNDGTQYVRRNEAWEAVDVPPGTVVSSTAPTTPDSGQLWYDLDTARTFVWTGTEWADASPDAANATVITSDNAPANPQDGDLWYRSTDGRTYVYYDDGASAQWVDANPATGASNWNYDGTTLTPGTAGTDVDLGTGDLSASTGTFSGALTASNAGPGLFTVGADGGLRLQRASGGATVQVQAVDISGNDEASIAFLNSANTQFYSYIGTGRSLAAGYGDYTLAFRTESTLGDFSFFTGGAGGSERMRIVGSTGDVYIGGLPASPNITLNADGTIVSGVEPAPDFTNTGVGIYKDGAVYIKRVNPDSEDFLRCIYNDSARFKLIANGDAQKLAAGQWTGISDVRAKNSITDYTAGLQEVVALRPVNYKLNGIDQSYIGLLAQEAETVMPEMVTSAPGEIDGVAVEDKRTLDPTAIQYALINAAKEMATRIEALESANAALEARLTALETQ